MDGIDGLLASLSALGADSLLTLPGVDEPTTASNYVSRILTLMRDREVDFEQAWGAALNRIQAPEGEEVYADPALSELVIEQRHYLEAGREFWKAAYEGRRLVDPSAWNFTTKLEQRYQHYQESRRTRKIEDARRRLNGLHGAGLASP